MNDIAERNVIPDWNSSFFNDFHFELSFIAQAMTA